ncbi:hypothetical protein GGX14DRAFT_579956 [Mycena pura]|uniref:Ubiquitin-like protease family profile domain-containing protein n=1 Tax=Mycena pura TaxID=153505 RepID=A0AAD6UPZ6_9AGAR|nr:hypothetical protein GGX14DRAFT_579956 [Mycena pura]
MPAVYADPPKSKHLPPHSAKHKASDGSSGDVDVILISDNEPDFDATEWIDPNNPNHRLPLWSIRFYREVTDLHNAQEQWLQSKYWLPNTEHFILDRVGWNSVRDGAFDGQLGWARVIDDEWLSGDNIDNIMHHIKACASEDPALKSSTTIAFLSFQREITKFATDPPVNPSRLLARYAAEIRAGKSILYNPVHLNENHWIAFKTDFAKRHFSYGDSMSVSSKPRRFLVILSDCGAARLRWFKIFLDRANAGFSAADVIEMQEQSFTDVVVPPTSSGSHAPMSLFNILNPVIQQTPSESVSSIVPAVAISEVASPTLLSKHPADSDVVPISGPATITAPPPPKTEDPEVTAPILKRKLAAVHRSNDSDTDEYNSEDAKRTARRKPPKKSSKEVKTRAKKTTAAERLAQLKADPNIILSNGSLKGSSSVVYCKCKPHFALSLEGEYLLKNWTSHKQSCELCTLVKPGARTQIIPPAVKKPPATGIASFFTVKPAAGAAKPPITKSSTSAEPVMKRAVIVGTCTYRTSTACALSTAVQLALHGIPVATNTLPQRSKWTDYEKRRLYQSLMAMARWSVYSSTGSIFAKGCLGLTTSLTHTCSDCMAVANLPGFKRAVRDARARARLPVDKFTAAIKTKMAHTPTILGKNAAANVKAHLARPAVIKILSSKAMYGPVGAYLSLFQQAQQGDLDDQESFVATCEQFTDEITRNKDPTGHAIHGIRYHPTFIKYSTLMRSFGPRRCTFRTANGPGRADEDTESDEEASEPCGTSDPSDEKLLANDTVRFAFIPTPVQGPRDDSPPGSHLSVSQAMAHAAHHVVTEQLLSDEAEKVEAELVAIEEQIAPNQIVLVRLRAAPSPQCDWVAVAPPLIVDGIIK